jgi:hypothetical protein
MRKITLLFVTAVAVLSGCASNLAPYDEQFVTERDHNKKPIAWELKPTQQQAQRAALRKMVGVKPELW